ncbi:MAG: hypothetical protein LBC30_03435 [Puniceicoccales bacterium]|jgi:hypothetical protein|nr:hypothetical protein [Puniceicoccales bacterium]
MSADSRTSPSSQQAWANYISFKGLTYLSFKGLRAGFNAIGGIFGRGIESTSRKARDGSALLSTLSQKQVDEEYKIEASSIPEAITIDPKTLSVRTKGQGTAEDTTKEKPIESGAGLLKTQDSSSAISNPPANASLRTKYMDLMSTRCGHVKSDMDRCLEDISALNKTSEELSQQAEALNKEAADLKQEASQAECSATKWSAWGQCVLTLGGICGTLGSLPLPAILAAISPIGATVGAVVGAGLISYSCVRKWQAALKTCESEKKQAVVQTKRDTQGIIGTKISISQNRFSTLSQEYTTLISIWQSIISAENEVRRAIINNIR